MTDLQLDLDPTLGKRAALEAALRDAIRNGRLVAGQRLPSSRTLASDLDMSRATAVAAYGQLVAEGFLLAEHGRSTTVADVPNPPPPAPMRHPFWTTPRFDFRPGEPATDSFPRRDWLRSVRHVLQDSPDDVFGYADPRGRPELRMALASQLGRSRSVLCSADSISVVGGFASAVSYLAEVLMKQGGSIAVEDPMLFLHRDLLELAGLKVVPIPVDGEGIIVDRLDGLDVGAVLVTPAHQHPVGATMSAERRSQLVAWARETDTWIIEDDYDGEFRYDRKPIGALQALAPDQVIYAGTASKTIAPALRLGWLVLPEGVRRAVQRQIHIRAGVSTVDQLALAHFIESGTYDRHVRAMRANYRDRRAEVVERLAAVAPWLEIVDHPAGLHLTARILDPAVDEDALVAAADEAGVGLVGLGICHIDPTTATHRGLMIGFGRPAQHNFAASVDALVEVLAAFR